jgi:phosphatidylinositol alpha 1,6-mannosyltransferase
LDENSEYQLVVIGDGPSRSYLQKVLPNALFTGKLSGNTLATHISSLDLFVHAGESETFCQAAQEALACGTPVLAPVQGGVKDFVHPGLNGLVVDFKTPEQLLETVDANWSFLTSPLTRRQARSSVEGKSWEALTQKLISHYLNAISSSIEGSRKVAS